MPSNKSNPLVMFLGLRGVGNIQGGVETHVMELIRHLAIPADSAEVIGRSPYRPTDGSGEIQGVRQVWLPTIRHPMLETPLHMLVGLAYAAIRRPRLLHIHGIGPSIAVPLARLLGLTVITTHHGEDYHREKWGRFARMMLRLGEYNCVRLSHACIAISPVAAGRLRKEFYRDIAFIPNGVAARVSLPPGEQLARYGLEKGKYIINVARVVPEKRQNDLVAAFEKARLPGVKLLLVGGSDHASAFARDLEQRVAGNPDIIMTGHLHGAPLTEIFCNAGAFVLPSTHEGLPIVLLEAMGFGLPVLVAELPVYHAMGLGEACIYPSGDVDELARRLKSLFGQEIRSVRWPQLADYQWPAIAEKTKAIYDACLRRYHATPA